MVDLLVTNTLAIKAKARSMDIEHTEMTRLCLGMIEIIKRKDKPEMAAEEIVKMTDFKSAFSDVIARKNAQLSHRPESEIHAAVIEEALSFPQVGLCRLCSDEEVSMEISWVNVFRAIGADCVSTNDACATIDDLTSGEVERKIMSEACHWHESERHKIDAGCGNASLYPERLLNAVLFNEGTRRVNVCPNCEEAFSTKYSHIAELTSQAINSLTCLYSDGRLVKKIPSNRAPIALPWDMLEAV